MVYFRLFLIAGLLILVMTACQGGGKKSIPTTSELPSITPALPAITPIIQTLTVTPSPISTVVVPTVPTETPDPGADDMPGYYDGLVITLNDVGQTIGMIPGQGILLRLGEEFDWSVSVNPPDGLTPNRKITSVPGEQGVFIARKKGRVSLSAIGDPVCLQADPPCARPSVLFTITFEVK